MWTPPRLVLLASLLVACHPAAEPQPADPEPDAAVDEPPDGGGRAVLPDDLKGFFHLPGVDATNLRLDEDRTFRWTIAGCDFGGGDSGRWLADHGGIVLLGEGDDESFTWVHQGTFAFPVGDVTLIATEEGLIARLSGRDGSLPEQLWERGGACPECGGSLGPTGQCACDDPWGDGPGCPLP
jgi:hypothetical protein